MSATLTAPNRETLMREPRPSLATLTKVELRKAYDTRAGLWLLVTIVGVALLALFGTLIFEDDDANKTFRSLLEMLQFLPLGFLLPVLGILLVTSEWSQRSALTTFTLTPNRWRIVAAKALALFVLALLSVAVTIVAAAFGAAVGGAPDAWREAGETIPRVALFQLINVSVGFAFGFVFLNSPLAIVLYFVIPTAWTILGEAISALDSAADWLDLNRTGSALFPDEGGGVSGEEWAQLATSLGLWLLVPLAIGMWRLSRAEVK
ncbi:MAG TPA: ABC transporter permease subunit [Solirubrobacteraceae bacterium]|nr:ABC transporter permease subunit [Solirubrobacteraceae bacterium]